MFTRFYNILARYICCCYNQTHLPNSLDSLPKNIPRFIPHVYSGLVIKVYDGDTITIVGRITGDPQLYKFNIRIAGIDCPEIRSKNENEKYVAILAREEVEKIILNKVVRLDGFSQEKYGRLLANVYINNTNIANLLIKKRLAVPYDGKKKTIIPDWKSFYQINEN